MARKNLLKGFQRPGGITSFIPSEVKQNYGKFSASPFEPGFGTTVGNTLRRVLLSSIQGYAITAVKITSYNADGAAHQISSEFEQIPNVREDTLEIINNLKQVRVKVPNDAEQEILLYEWEGAREIKSDDFGKSGQLEVKSVGQHVLTMMEGAKIEVELQVDLGRGYVPSETNAQYIEVVNTIPMDAIFSPVKKVKYQVEPTRVGQRSDYDKLIMEIWTDGTVSPDDVLAEAAKIAKEHFQPFINFDENLVTSEADFSASDERVRQILTTPVEELDLTVRSRNGLEYDNIKTLGDLIQKSEADLIKIPNFGKRSLQEIKEKLQEWDLNLGVTSATDVKGPGNEEAEE
jgi:DNA-directed RNA polymerase subunit alpha